eukprot:SAG31_NODE_3172_length_4590_cov_2.002672_3_plen_192_part_00
MSTFLTDGFAADGVNSFVCDCISTASTLYEGALCEHEVWAADVLLGFIALCSIPCAFLCYRCRLALRKIGWCIAGEYTPPSSKYKPDDIGDDDATESLKEHLHKTDIDDAEYDSDLDDSTDAAVLVENEGLLSVTNSNTNERPAKLPLIKDRTNIDQHAMIHTLDRPQGVGKKVGAMFVPVAWGAPKVAPR